MGGVAIDRSGSGMTFVNSIVVKFGIGKSMGSGGGGRVVMSMVILMIWYPYNPVNQNDLW